MGSVQQWARAKIMRFVLLILINLLCFVSAVKSADNPLESQAVEELVKEWSPLVWLAPGEKYLPMDVDEFLKNVHPELPSFTNKPNIYDLNDDPEKYEEYYANLQALDKFQSNIYTNRIKRTYKNLGSDTSLPTGESSESWYLVTNQNLEELKGDTESFIYGKDPNKDAKVPVYAVVTPCSSSLDNSNKFETKINRMKYVVTTETKQNRYIPVSMARSLNEITEPKIQIVLAESAKEANVSNEESISVNEVGTQLNVDSNETDDKNVTLSRVNGTVNDSKKTKENWITEDNDGWKPSTLTNVIDFEKPTKKDSIGSFHVTYWMFYPYSQGKMMCSIDLGPFGPVPIPLIFGFCLGTSKEFGSHIGDWEHVSLFFPSIKKPPKEMYVSAHDAGAFYSYEQLTGTFEFRKQETRKGIFQKPNFPKTVRTSKNHPVLFSAEGSHGLWTAPGKHRYVRVPRLYDINGFGIPWQTWNNINIYYSNKLEDDISTPHWLKFRGKWGNQKSKCHPLTKMGLHLCEISDGPTGIPRKTPHFQCSKF